METFKLILLILSIILIILIIILNVFCIVFTVRMVNPKKRYSTIDHENFIKSKLGIDVNTLVKRDKFTFTMSDGYIINAEASIINDSNKFVILSHGITSTRISSIRFAKLFNDLGYNTIIYDLRGHGDNARYKCTLGINEANDLSEIIIQTYQKFGDDIFLGLFGVSLGASTSILVTSINQRIKFIVEDCGFANLRNVPQDRAKDLSHLPRFIFTIPLRFYFRLFTNMSYLDILPSDSASKMNIPLLIMHGDNDKFVDVENAYIFNEVTTSLKMMYIFKGSGHCASFSDHKDEYKEVLRAFLNKVEE